ncbi:MAG: outer membrane lipoprotein chaperone LolA [Gammaproteobacteria bacterium]|nr:outer membrane lipoprotein chaperone LolA [Gammaproteobacteria bacterium]
MNFIKRFILLFFILLPVASAGEAVDVLDSFLKNTRSIQCKFQQKLLDQNGILLQQSAGDFYLHRPGRFVWDYTLPYPQKIVSNGKKIWIYDSELEQVSVKKYDQVLSGAPVMLLDQYKNLNEDFLVQELGLRAGQYWVKLTPKQAGDFKEIQVGMKNKLLRTMKLMDSFEQMTEIEFDHMQVNINLNSSLFKFITPEGTDVMGDF